MVVSDRDKKRQLEGDLDNIALYALRKEPERRYASVRDLAEDIRRYLASRPIAARPNTTVYRAQRFFKRNKSFGWQLAAFIVLAVAVALFLVIPQLRSFRQSLFSSNRQPTSPVNDKSVAVLPFDSFNTEKESNYFVDGVQDNILTDLAKVSDLKVISRSAVEHYRGAAKDPREIGRALNVANVLEGTVQKSR